MHALKAAIKKSLRPYFRFRRIPFVWYLYNLGAKRRFIKNPPPLSDIDRRIADTLREDGIAFASFEEIFPECSLRELQEYSENLVQGAEVIGGKKFEYHLWNPKRLYLDPSNPFLKIALHPRVLGIGAVYMRMYVRLMSFRGQRTMIMEPNREPTLSQLWHRDPSEYQQFKMFLYLNDVDEDSGPFWYVKKSHNLGKYKKIHPQRLPYQLEYGRLSDEEVESAPINAKDIIACVGKAGTVIFADTCGLHKGGYSKERSRHMYMGCYTAHMPLGRRDRRRVPLFPEEFLTARGALTPIQLYAITPPRIELP